MPKFHAAKSIGTLCDRKGRSAKHDSFSYINVALSPANVTCSFCIERMLALGGEITAEQAEMLPKRHVPRTLDSDTDDLPSEDIFENDEEFS